MPEADANSTPAKPPADKPKAEAEEPEKSADWGTLGCLFLALLGLIFVGGNLTSFGEFQNLSPVSNQNEPEFNEVDFNPNNVEENSNFVFSEPIEPDFATTIVDEADFPSGEINNHLPYIPTETPCLERPVHPPPKPIKKH